MNSEELKNAAEASMGGSDIRARVRDITLAAIRDRKFDFNGMREVMTHMAEGISVGAEKRGSDVKEALSAAFAGLDEAFTKSAHATQLALKEMASKGKELNDTELKAALDGLKKMEGDFMSTMSATAERAGGKVKTEMKGILEHATRSGTDTSQIVAKTMSEFSQRMAAVAGETGAASFEAAKKMSDRFVQAASGFLAGMSDALSKPSDSNKKH